MTTVSGYNLPRPGIQLEIRNGLIPKCKKFTRNDHLCKLLLLRCMGFHCSHVFSAHHNPKVPCKFSPSHFSFSPPYVIDSLLCRIFCRWVLLQQCNERIKWEFRTFSPLPVPTLVPVLEFKPTLRLVLQEECIAPLLSLLSLRRTLLEFRSMIIFFKMSYRMIELIGLILSVCIGACWVILVQKFHSWPAFFLFGLIDFREWILWLTNSLRSN